jgi:hypothetical protein
MNLKPLGFRALAALVLAGLTGASVARAVDAIGPAPIMERPLTPAVGDQPGQQPSPQHVWVPGHWRWSEGAYVWETGRWDVPPVSNAVWTAPQWQKVANGFVLKEGFWQEVDPAQLAARVVPAPVAAPAEEIAVVVAPPPPQREIIVERPSPAYVWVGGYWHWRAGKHVWIGGQWQLPPRANAVWVAPRWELRGGRHVFVQGFWRDVGVAVAVGGGSSSVVVAASTGPAQEVMVVSAPPPPRAEVVFAPPSRFHVWIPGYWAWRGGRHVWVAGHYEMPPHGQHLWHEPRWERRGGSYIFVEGRWGR